MQSNLHDKALNLVLNRPRHQTLEDIAKATGLKKQWLQNFTRQRDIDPGVRRVETLYCYLANRKLEL